MVVGCGFMSSCLENVIHLSSSICHPSVIHPSNHRLLTALNTAALSAGLKFQHCRIFIRCTKTLSSKGRIWVVVRRPPGSRWERWPHLASVEPPQQQISTVPAGLHGNAASLSSPNCKPKHFTDVLFIQDLVFSSLIKNRMSLSYGLL